MAFSSLGGFDSMIDCRSRDAAASIQATYTASIVKTKIGDVWRRDAIDYDDIDTLQN